MRKHKQVVALVGLLVLLLLCNLYSLHNHIDNDGGALVLSEASPPTPFKTQVFLFDSSSLSLRGVKMKHLVKQWGSSSTYDDLLRLSSPARMNPEQALLAQQHKSAAATNNNMRVITIWHAVPKTAGTTVRKAIFKHIANTCPTSGRAATQQGAFRDVSSLHRLISNCPNTHDYGLGGRMTFRAVDESNTIAVVHTLAFRSYKEWARSALNQIVKVSGIEHCDTVRERLSNCEDYRELSFYQYTKTQLKRIRRQSLSGNDIVVLYDYRDTNLFHSTIRKQLGLPPLKLETYNTNRTTDRCPDDVLDMFYNCHEL